MPWSKNNPYYKLLAILLLVITIASPMLVLTTYANVGIQPVKPGPINTPGGEPKAPTNPSQPVVQPTPGGSHHKVIVYRPKPKPVTSEESHHKVKARPPSTGVKIVKNLKHLIKHVNVRRIKEYGVVTLITGDVVQFAKVNNTYLVSVKPVRPNEKFFTLAIKGRLYVIPYGVNLRKFDPELFDVTYLAKYYSKLSYLPLIIKVSSRLSISPKSVLRSYMKLVKGVKGYSFTIIKAFSMKVPYKDVAKVYSLLAKDPRVTKVVLDKVIRVARLPLNAGPVIAPALYKSARLVGAVYARKLGINGTGVRVAVLDTGIDLTHPDFYFPNGTSKIVAAKSFVPGENVTDYFGHGTHVAGIIAGTGRASNGSIVGIAPGALLVIGKVLCNAGWGYESWIINGIEWAIEENASIISMSLGGWPTTFYDPLEAAVINATEHGVVVVIAAGNEGPSYFTIDSPGQTSAAITVAAVNDNLEPAWWSSVGPSVKLTAKPDIAAPGVMITSARAKGTYMGYPASNYYQIASGTSMATPHVSGLIALLIQGIKYREKLLNQSIPMSPMNLKYMLMDYSEELPWDPTEVGIGFANITTLIGALVNPNETVAYILPSNETLKGMNGTTIYHFKLIVIPGKLLINKTITFNITANVYPWLSSQVPSTAVNITPSIVTLKIENTSVITETINVTVNWTSMDAGFHYLYLNIKPSNTTLVPAPTAEGIRTMTGLFKLQRMTITILSKEYIEGIAAVIPELYEGTGYLPTMFEFNSTYNTIEVPVVVPGVDYAVMIAAATPGNEIITTVYNGPDSYTDPTQTYFNYTIDIDEQLSNDFLQELYIAPPSHMALPEPFFVADEENLNGYIMAVYAFGNSVTVVTPYYRSWLVDDSEYEVYPTLIVMWPTSSGEIRAYLAQTYLPESGTEIFTAKPNYYAQVELRRIGSEAVYIPIGLIPEYGEYVSISPQYGFITPKIVNVGIYANYYADLYAFYTPAYMYVTDNQGNRIGLIQFDNIFLTYSVFENNQAFTDPLRMPYGTTVWYMDLTGWKGIDGNDYLCGEEYIRLLDSWWNTYGVISAYTILYINGKEVLVSVDDDPGVYTFGWASIGRNSSATLTLATHGWLSWANKYGDYVDFMNDINGVLSFKLNGLPTNITSGVPPIMYMDIGWFKIPGPGYGVPLILVSPLTLNNIVPSNVTKTANMTVLIQTPIDWGLSGNLSVPYVKVYITNSTGYPVEQVYSGKPEEIEPGYYVLTGTFDPTKLSPGYYGIEVLTSANYTTVEKLTGHNVTVTISFTYSAYPAIKTAPLVVKPFYVGPYPWCNFTSISEAVKYAYPNQTIYVLPGVYTEGNITIDKPLKIIGIVINGTEPVIEANANYAHVFGILNTENVLISNMTITGTGFAWEAILSVDSSNVVLHNLNIYVPDIYAIAAINGKELTLSNIKVAGAAGISNPVIIVFVNGLTIKGLKLELPSGVLGFTGLALYNVYGSVELRNVYISYYYSSPIDMSVIPDLTKLAYGRVYINNSGLLEPVSIYVYYNESLTLTPTTKYVVLNAMQSNVTLSSSRIAYLDINVENSNVAINDIKFINRSCRTFNIISTYGGNLVISNVTNLQPLAPGLYTNESETYILPFGLTEVEIANSTLSQVWMYGNYSVTVNNDAFYSTPKHYGLIVDYYVNNVSVTNSTFTSIGTTEEKGVVGLLINMPANDVVVIGNRFTNFIYGIVAYAPYNIYAQRLAIKDNVYVGVSVPVTLLPPGTVPTWIGEFYYLGIPPTKALPYRFIHKGQNPFYSESTNSKSLSSTPPPMALHLNSTVSHVLISSNTFINYSVGINASIPLNASIVIVNNTFISSNPRFDVFISSANYTGLWLNTFSNNSNIFMNSSITYLNYNNFLGRSVKIKLAGRFADARFNYFAGNHIITAYNGLRLAAGSSYATPLSLPVKRLVPIIEFPNKSLIVAGLTRVLSFKFINPYFTNISFNYAVTSAPGLRVSKVKGLATLTPSYINASFSEVSVNATGLSPGTSAIYVEVNGFKYPYPIKVLPASIGLLIHVAKSVLRGSTIPVILMINSKVNASMRGELVISLANGLEIKDPSIYRYATAAAIPLNISPGLNYVSLNLTALYVGNASITASLYVDGLTEAVNSTKAYINITPNPHVRFSITKIYYSNVTVGEYSYIEIELTGDSSYTQLINVTVATSNTSVAGLGYNGSSKYVSTVIRTDPYARIAYVYVPVKGVSPGESVISVKAVSVGDNISVAQSFTLHVKPKLAWAYESNITMVSNSYNESSIEIKYPNTTVKAKLWLSLYASKISASYEALSKLMSVPWGCVEQTTSPLLADIELYTYISRNNLWSNLTGVINRTKLEDYIRYGVQRLLYYHLSCNSSMCWFAWYPGMSPAKFFTIYGTLGLLRAVEFAYIKYPAWTGNTFNLSVNITYLNESIEKLLAGIIRLRNAEGYWSYPPGAMDYITDDIPLTSMAVYVLSEALNLGYLPYGYNATEVREVISQAVNWLEGQQLSIGGWKPNTEASKACPYSTGYVLAALAEASKAGIQVNLSVIEKAITYLNVTAEGSGTIRFWVPSTEWASWWGIDDYVATAQVVLGLADTLSSPINNSLTTTYRSLAVNLSHAGALFLTSVANEWLTAADTCEDSIILRALNSVNVDLLFSKPLIINVKILGNGTQLLFNKDYTIITPYNYTYVRFNLNTLGWLSRFKRYVITVKLVSGSGQAIVTAYSIYGYIPSTSKSGATVKGLTPEQAGRKVSLVIAGRKYVIKQVSGKSTNIGLEVGLRVSSTYVVKGGKVFATITLKGVGANLFAVVVTEKALPGFKIVINKTLLGSNVVFDEDRYNRSGGRILSSNSTTIVVTGGILAFAVQSVSTEGTSITYELIPVNVSTGKVTLPPVKAWMFYTPIGKNITGETVTQPTIVIGLPMSIRMVSEVISKGQEIGDNNVLYWGDKVGMTVTLPSGINVTVKAVLEGSNVTYTIAEESVRGGYVTLYLDTLKLVSNASRLEGTYVTLKIQVIANGTILTQKSYRLYMAHISRLDLFKRMVEIELKYATSTPMQRQSIINNEIKPLKTLWGEG